MPLHTALSAQWPPPIVSPWHCTLPYQHSDLPLLSAHAIAHCPISTVTSPLLSAHAIAHCPISTVTSPCCKPMTLHTALSVQWPPCCHSCHCILPYQYSDLPLLSSHAIAYCPISAVTSPCCHLMSLQTAYQYSDLPLLSSHAIAYCPISAVTPPPPPPPPPCCHLMLLHTALSVSDTPPVVSPCYCILPYQYSELSPSCDPMHSDSLLFIAVDPWVLLAEWRHSVTPCILTVHCSLL